jgi:RNA polymerase sigma factor (sigma-70 family)
MSNEPLDLLLEKLSAGDMEAVDRLFSTYEPYLRMVVRRHLPARLRPKFDSADVVQSVWACVLLGLRDRGWRFTTAEQLRAFLVLVTRHRLTDRHRHFRHAAERERPLSRTMPDQLPESRQPRPSELVQADDLWEKMLALCPTEHHELLRLRRQGLPLTEIAQRTGLHEGSVRRVLRQLARQLAFATDPVVGETDSLS